MTKHVANRERVLRDLRRELVGPDAPPLAKELDIASPQTFGSYQDLHAPWVEKDSRAEIIGRDTPTKRYGVGVLFPPPPKTVMSDPEPDLTGQGAASEEVSDPSQDKREKALAEISAREGRGTSEENDPNEFDASGANSYRPSAMAVSFLAALPRDGKIVVRVPAMLPEDHPFSDMAVNGRYIPIKVGVQGKDKEGKTKKPREQEIWVRRQVTLTFELPTADILAHSRKAFRYPPVAASGHEGLNLSLEILARPRGMDEPSHHRLITVNLVNRANLDQLQVSRPDAFCLFQVYFEVEVADAAGAPLAAVLPYPTPLRHDEEEQSNALLYRHLPTFAAGHGCAADWRANEVMRAWTVRAECLPVHEVPSITPDITRKDGTEVRVPMRGLAGLDPTFDIPHRLQEVCDAYEEWITDREADVTRLGGEHVKTAVRHLRECRTALGRMRAGLEYLQVDADAMEAFKWANEAMLLQQLRSDLELRHTEYDEADMRFKFSAPYIPVSREQKGSRGQWRAFQIAFLLMSLRSVAKGDDPDRETADLIWFPAGGGKTEAYLGLAAFALFMRRLRDPQDAGVHVLMRYTLRLLTAQQFQRGAGLMCAMDYVRRSHESRLGQLPFSAGIWLGGSTTPNNRDDARAAFRKLVRGNAYAENPFMLTKCPWCGAQMGPLRQSKGSGKNANAGKYKKGYGKSASSGPAVPGYEDDGTTITFHCPDTICAFSRGLPVFVIDEDVYEQRPSLVIGTVDKFAMLAWRPEARALFGLGADGSRVHSPPGLIIQDELHLISGPLGSMSGLYEPVIEELCTDRRGSRAVKPKLVCSTATIRAYREQIRALYGRTEAVLFPPPGLDVADSFFSRYAYDQDSPTKLAHGRMYVGVNGPGHGSLQTTQVRTFSALLQSPTPLVDMERDPWWTLLTFFNSLRELGTTLTLFQSDIPDYLKVLRSRYGLDFPATRSLWNIQELTGRLNSEEVPRAIEDLQRRCGQGYPVDVCLASSIIEVGVDIGRLSLMTVVGQPKTTAQYIQVTGRVGREWWDRPGLVVTIYNASKPRDRSHFEKFRTYHQQLYAQVEPTSVTPFSPQALDRALHAAMVAYVRQLGARAGGYGPADKPDPFPETLVEDFGRIIEARAAIVDPGESANLRAMLAQRKKEWQLLGHDKYKAAAAAAASNPGLLSPAGAHIEPAARHSTWMTPQSMRSVDAECQAEITSVYVQDALGAPHA